MFLTCVAKSWRAAMLAPFGFMDMCAWGVSNATPDKKEKPDVDKN